MDENYDEIDVIIVGPTLTDVSQAWNHQTFINWLCNNIAWYGSKFYDRQSTWPPDEKGWVRQIDISDELQALSSFSYYFQNYIPSERINTAKIIRATVPDDNILNNEQTITIKVR